MRNEHLASSISFVVVRIRSCLLVSSGRSPLTPKPLLLVMFPRAVLIGDAQDPVEKKPLISAPLNERPWRVCRVRAQAARDQNHRLLPHMDSHDLVSNMVWLLEHCFSRWPAHDAPATPRLLRCLKRWIHTRTHPGPFTPPGQFIARWGLSQARSSVCNIGTYGTLCGCCNAAAGNGHCPRRRMLATLQLLDPTVTAAGCRRGIAGLFPNHMMAKRPSGLVWTRAG